jgi:hypothetical protein
MWQDPPIAGWDATDPKISRMIHYSVINGTIVGGQHHFTAVDPSVAAEAVARKMYEARYGAPQTLFEGRVCLLLQNWGFAA